MSKYLWGHNNNKLSFLASVPFFNGKNGEEGRGSYLFSSNGTEYGNKYVQIFVDTVGNISTVYFIQTRNWEIIQVMK